MRPALFAAPTFVVLWSTGFIGAKYGLPYAEPATFLFVRFAIVAALLGVWAVLAGASWPRRDQIGPIAIIGVLMHAIYLGGVFQAIAWGVEAGTAALIAGLQPIAVAALALAALGERLTRLQWLGMAAGLLGVGFVVSSKLSDGFGDPAGVAMCALAMLAIALGSTLQKRWAGDAPLATGNVVQYLAACAALAPFALLFETRRIDWTGEFVFALFWLVAVLSIGAISLLYLLLRAGEASRVASLFFLTPASAALIAWPLFGETLGPAQIAGVALASLGVALVMRGGAAVRTPPPASRRSRPDPSRP